MRTMRTDHFWPAAVGVMLFLFAAAACGFDDAGDERPQDDDHERTEAVFTEESVETPEPLSDQRSVADRIEDARIAARVKQALAGERSLRTFDFEPDVLRGEVTLYGDVRSQAQYDRADAIVREVDGVRDVTNAVTVEGQRVLADSGDEGDAEEGGARQAPGAEFHTVQSGESLWTIARNYDTSVGRIQDLNNLSNSSLQPGDRIRVR